MRAIAGYALLMAMWPVVGGVYATAYHGMCNRALGRFGGEGSVHFRLPDMEPGARSQDLVTDTIVKVKNTTNRYFRERTGRTRYTGYVPMALCLSLILATPVSWKRRLISSACGLLLVQLIVLFRWSVLLLKDFSDPNLQIRQFVLGAFARDVVLFLDDPICASVLFLSFAVPAAIWVSVTFRRADLAWVRDMPLS